MIKLLGFTFATSVTTRIEYVRKQRVWNRPRGFILGEAGRERGCIALRWGHSESDQVLRLFRST